MAFTGTIPARRLGSAGPEVPAFALGSWNTWDRMTADEAVALVRRAREVGAAFFDVAHYNTGPHAENARTDILFGEAIRSAGLSRDEYVLCGKLWLWEYPAGSLDAQLSTSLDRIGVDKADIAVVGDYFGDPDIEQIVRDVQTQIDAGRLDFWGVNNWPAAGLRRAFAVAEREGLTPPVFAQLKYGLARRSMAEGPEYAEFFSAGLGMQASDVFEGGILAGKLAPTRKIGADVGGIRDAIIAAWPEVQRVAASLDATPTQLGLAFALTHPATANVLFGASSVRQLDDNLGAFALLDRVGPQAVREAAAGLWLDGKVSSDGIWPSALA